MPSSLYLTVWGRPPAAGSHSTLPLHGKPPIKVREPIVSPFPPAVAGRNGEKVEGEPALRGSKNCHSPRPSVNFCPNTVGMQCLMGPPIRHCTRLEGTFVAFTKSRAASHSAAGRSLTSLCQRLSASPLRGARKPRHLDPRPPARSQVEPVPAAWLDLLPILLSCLRPAIVFPITIRICIFLPLKTCG